MSAIEKLSYLSNRGTLATVFYFSLIEYCKKQENKFFDQRRWGETKILERMKTELVTPKNDPTFHSRLFSSFNRFVIYDDVKYLITKIQELQKSYQTHETKKLPPSLPEGSDYIDNIKENLKNTVNMLKTHGNKETIQSLTNPVPSQVPSTIDSQTRGPNLSPFSIPAAFTTTNVKPITVNVITKCIETIKTVLAIDINATEILRNVMPLPSGDANANANANDPAYNFNVNTTDINTGKIPDDNVEFESGNEYVMGNNNDEGDNDENVGDVDANFDEKNENVFGYGLGNNDEDA